MPHDKDRTRESRTNGAAPLPLVDAFIDLWLENVAAWSLSAPAPQRQEPADGHARP